MELAISRADDELKKRAYNLKKLTESVNCETTDFNEKACSLKLLIFEGYKL